MAGISDADIAKIIVQGDAAVLDKQAKDFGEALKAEELTKSQIRNIFGTVRQIQAGWDRTDPKSNLRKVLLLKPRLAYQAARETKTKGLKSLATVLTSAINLVAEAKDTQEQKRRFGYFVDMFEAILAYHTAAGGK